MNKSYLSQQLLTPVFIGIAVVVALASLIYSNKLAKNLSIEERRKIEIWASATEILANGEADTDIGLILKVLQSNTTIPVILYDKTTDSFTSNNIELPEKNQEEFLRKKMEAFERQHPPIELKEVNQLVYYDDSYTLKQLQIYPYVQLLIISVFIALAFFALNRSRRAEQNKVWVGLSKETAHQLGTPISSLVAWTEYLKLKEIDPALVTEIEKDVHRLEIIAERFSKIGSVSDKKKTSLQSAVEQSVAYLSSRIPNHVKIKYNFPERVAWVELNESLFSWVMENLVKNAADAMSGEGTITFSLSEKGKNYLLDISDTGAGMQKANFNSVFEPGFTTKPRGWGLGLSLVKRIVETYHNGKIFVAKSEIGKGTTFRIVLKKLVKN